METIELQGNTYALAKPSLAVLTDFDRELLKAGVTVEQAQAHPFIVAESALWVRMKPMQPELNRRNVAEMVDDEDSFTTVLEITTELITKLMEKRAVLES